MPTIEEYLNSIAAEYATATSNQVNIPATVAPQYYPTPAPAPVAPSPDEFMGLGKSEYYDYGGAQYPDYAPEQEATYDAALGGALTAIAATTPEALAAGYSPEQRYDIEQGQANAYEGVAATRPSPDLREMALADDPTQAIYGDPFGEAYRSVRNPINEVYKDYLRDPILKPAVSTALDYLKPVAPNLGFNVNRDILGPAPVLPEITNRGLTDVLVPQNIEQALMELVPGIGTVPGTTSALRNAARQVLDNPALLRRLALAQGKSMDEIAALVGRMLDPDYAAVRTAKGGSGLSDEAYDALRRTPGAAESVMKTTPDVVPSRTALPEAGKTITRNFNQTGVTITGEELPNTYQVTIGRGRQLATGRGEGSDLTALSDARHFLKTLQEENPEARFIGFPT